MNSVLGKVYRISPLVKECFHVRAEPKSLKLLIFTQWKLIDSEILKIRRDIKLLNSVAPNMKNNRGFWV